MTDLNTRKKRLPLLEDEAILLRPSEQKFADRIFPLLSDPDTMRYMFQAAINVEETAKILTFVDSLGVQTIGWWAIESKKSSEFVGMVMYFGVNHINKYCSVAYLVAPAYRRQGLATRAVQLVMPYLFCELGINRVEAEAEIENNASTRFLYRLGFTREAKKLRQRVFLANAYRDVQIFSILAEDWAQLVLE